MSIPEGFVSYDFRFMEQRRLDIGVASYRNPQRLRETLQSIAKNSVTNWRCFIIHNPSESEDEAATVAVISEFVNADARFVGKILDSNVGYAGAVNELFRLAETEYIAYCDNDIEILTHGWDEQLCGYMDRFHEIGLMFPNGGPYPIDRGNYKEVLWGVGYCWIVNRLAMADTGEFDESIGHQHEADYCQRVRMAGRRCAAATEVHVAHNATATNDPASIERISRGVVQWVNKWNAYFNGVNFNYHSPNVTRFEDWPPNALYLEEYWKLKLPTLNASPEVTVIDGREYDLIRVPRYKDFYRGRII